MGTGRGYSGTIKKATRVTVSVIVLTAGRSFNLETDNQQYLVFAGDGHPVGCREVRVLERIGSTPTRAWCKTQYFNI